MGIKNLTFYEIFNCVGYLYFASVQWQKPTSVLLRHSIFSLVYQQKPTSVLLGHPVFCQFLLAKTHFRHFRETCILPACSSKSPFPSFLVPFISLECSGKNTLPSFTVSYYRQIIFTYVLISVQSNSFEKNHSFFFFSFLSVQSECRVRIPVTYDLEKVLNPSILPDIAYALKHICRKIIVLLQNIYYEIFTYTKIIIPTIQKLCF